MKRIFKRFAMASGVVLMSGAMVMAQQRPMGSSPQPTTNNPAANSATNPAMSNAQQAQMQQEQNSTMRSMQDKAFVKKAAEGGMAEVQLGKLAQEKSSSPDVKQFAEKMVNDHTQLNEQMQPIAQKLGVSSPKGISKQDKKEISKLETLSGQQFDNAYIKYMIKDHKKDLSEFREEAQNTQNSQLKQAAQQGAQVINGHLQLAEQIAQSHNINAKGE